MKTRLGFVSNSSSCSFHIIGWDQKDFDALAKDLPPRAQWDKIREIMAEIKEKYGLYLCEVPTPEGHGAIGFGEYHTDIDHYNEDWEDYECDPPSNEECHAAEQIAKEYGLPEPQNFKATFRDG